MLFNYRNFFAARFMLTLALLASSWCETQESGSTAEFS